MTETKAEYAARRLAEGASRKEVAEELGVAVNTVKVYARRGREIARMRASKEARGE